MPRPARIDRSAVLAAALELADEGGLAALSMRAVAEQVGVTPMALYRHVGTKSQLLDGLVELLLHEQHLPDPALPWPARLDALSAGLRATARDHPEVFPLLLQRPVATEAARSVREVAYTALREAGVEEIHIPRTERALSTFALGFAASEAAGRFTATSERLDEEFAWAASRILQALISQPTSASDRAPE